MTNAQIKLTKRFGLDVYEVFIYGVYVTEFLSRNGAQDYINKFELAHQELLNNEII
jgi:hypothetical protein